MKCSNQAQNEEKLATQHSLSNQRGHEKLCPSCDIMLQRSASEISHCDNSYVNVGSKEKVHNKAVAETRIFHQVFRFLLIELQQNIVSHAKQDQFADQEEHFPGTFMGWFIIVCESSSMVKVSYATYCSHPWDGWISQRFLQLQLFVSDNNRTDNV